MLHFTVTLWTVIATRGAVVHANTLHGTTTWMMYVYKPNVQIRAPRPCSELIQLMLRVLAALADPLPIEPQEDGERDPEHDREAREEAVPAAVAEAVEHLHAKEREREAEHAARDGRGSERGRRERERIDEVQEDRLAVERRG